MPKKSQIVRQTKEEKEKLVPVYDDAVKNINKLIEQSAKNLVDIGNYLIKKFFDGDVAAAKSRSPKKRLSLRTLSLHEEIDCSYTTLSRAVDVAVVQDELGSVASVQQLTSSHLRALAAVDDASSGSGSESLRVFEAQGLGNVKLQQRRRQVCRESGEYRLRYARRI